METLKAILTRRSIRKYTNEKVSNEQIEEILKAGMYAPSSYNNQSWQFIVFNRKELLLEILRIIPHAEMLKEAAAAVLICGDKNLEQNIDLLIQNCSAATQNALLAIHDLGLGGVWISVYPNEETLKGLKELFRYPDSIIPISLISFGYPNEAVKSEERFKREKIHYNSW